MTMMLDIYRQGQLLIVVHSDGHAVEMWTFFPVFAVIRAFSDRYLLRDGFSPFTEDGLVDTRGNLLADEFISFVDELVRGREVEVTP